MKSLNQENGLKLRGFRKQNKLTQSAVAELIGKATSEVCRYEKGDFPIPDQLIDIINETYHLSLVKSGAVGKTSSKPKATKKTTTKAKVTKTVETATKVVESKSTNYVSSTSSVPFSTKGHFSKRLGSVIKLMGMTQGEFASKFKLTKSHVFRLVNKQTTNLSVQTLRALWKAGINIVDLIK